LWQCPICPVPRNDHYRLFNYAQRRVALIIEMALIGSCCSSKIIAPDRTSDDPLSASPTVEQAPISERQCHQGS
jgi:hypothetical protein